MISFKTRNSSIVQGKLSLMIIVMLKEAGGIPHITFAPRPATFVSSSVSQHWGLWDA